MFYDRWNIKSQSTNSSSNNTENERSSPSYSMIPRDVLDNNSSILEALVREWALKMSLVSRHACFRWPLCSSNRVRKISPLAVHAQQLSTIANASTETTKPAHVVFMDSKIAYASKSNLDLLRGILVLFLCHGTIVRNAERLLGLSRTVFGSTITNSIIRNTFFSHFCAGESEAEALATMRKLRTFGIGGILDFAAEGDVSVQKLLGQPLSREYEYESEKVCDAHLKNFETCVAVAEKGGFAAVKVTALGDAETIRRISLCVLEIRALFGRLLDDPDANGVLNKERFENIYLKHFKGGRKEADELFESIMTSAQDRFYKDQASLDDEIDVWEWLSFVTPRVFVDMIKTLKAPPANFEFTVEDSEKMERMIGRLDKIARKASERGVKVMIDAEQTYFQPAIDLFTLELQRRHNRGVQGPIVFSTYQAYLKDSRERLRFGLNAARREKWTFACKIVRGAYMVRERALALEQNRPSPVHDTIEDTAQSYHDCCDLVLRSSKDAELVVASHNRESVNVILDTMKERDRPIGNVAFAQLYGMADGVSFGLAAMGHPVFKYLPFGPVNEVVPYLVRRAQENSSVADGAVGERAMMIAELKRRMFG